MPSRFDRYRVKDGATVLGERYFNPVLQDIDVRLAALEDVRVSWEDAVQAVADFGLLRINEIVGPALVSANEGVAEIEAKRLAAVAAMDALQASIETLEDDIAADLQAWKDAQIAELEAMLDHVAVTGNPHGTTAADIGLGDVDNTSDADKPISTAVAAALAALPSSNPFSNPVALAQAHAMALSF